MEDLDIILKSLREHDLLKIVFMAVPEDGEGSALLAHAYGRPLKLPPKEGIKMLSDEEVKKEGISLFVIDASDKNLSPQKVKPELMKIMKDSKKYITPLEYDGKTRYETILSFYDMVFGLIGELRNEYTRENFNTDYDKSNDTQQEETRNRYPATIFLRNVD